METTNVLPYPLPDSAQKTLRLLADNIDALTGERGTPRSGVRFEYQQAEKALDDYIATLRATIGQPPPAPSQQ